MAKYKVVLEYINDNRDNIVIMSKIIKEITHFSLRKSYELVTRTRIEPQVIISNADYNVAMRFKHILSINSNVVEVYEESMPIEEGVKEVENDTPMINNISKNEVKYKPGKGFVIYEIVILAEMIGLNIGKKDFGFIFLGIVFYTIIGLAFSYFSWKKNVKNGMNTKKEINADYDKLSKNFLKKNDVF